VGTAQNVQSRTFKNKSRYQGSVEGDELQDLPSPSGGRY